MLSFEEYAERIKQKINKNENSRVKILEEIIQESDLKEILRLYRGRESKFSILEKTKMSYDKISNGIDLIDSLNRYIDAAISAKNAELRKAKKCNSKKNINNKDLIDKVKRFKLQYKQFKRNNNLGKLKIKENIDVLVKIIEVLGNRSSDLLFLGEVYMDLEDYDKSLQYLENCNDNDLTVYERIIRNEFETISKNKQEEEKAKKSIWKIEDER